jgi:hypothetical protein
MGEAEMNIARVMAKGDKWAISFAGLGFVKLAQANSWIEAEMPHHPTGAIVIIHIVFKRIHHSMSNVSTLSVMQQLVKIKVQSIANGSAIMLYGQKIPKLFSKSSGHMVIKDEASSFLDLVPTWKEWDNAQTGFCPKRNSSLLKVLIWKKLSPSTNTRSSPTPWQSWPLPHQWLGFTALSPSLIPTIMN